MTDSGNMEADVPPKFCRCLEKAFEANCGRRHLEVSLGVILILKALA